MWVYLHCMLRFNITFSKIRNTYKYGIFCGITIESDVTLRWHTGLHAHRNMRYACSKYTKQFYGFQLHNCNGPPNNSSVLDDVRRRGHVLYDDSSRSGKLFVRRVWTGFQTYEWLLLTFSTTRQRIQLLHFLNGIYDTRMWFVCFRNDLIDFYSVSYAWYGAFGVFICIGVGLVVSAIAHYAYYSKNLDVSAIMHCAQGRTLTSVKSRTTLTTYSKHLSCR